jgi:hypothetical protein
MYYLLLLLPNLPIMETGRSRQQRHTARAGSRRGWNAIEEKERETTCTPPPRQRRQITARARAHLPRCCAPVVQFVPDTSYQRSLPRPPPAGRCPGVNAMDPFLFPDQLDPGTQRMERRHVPPHARTDAYRDCCNSCSTATRTHSPADPVPARFA